MATRKSTSKASASRVKTTEKKPQSTELAKVESKLEFDLARPNVSANATAEEDDQFHAYLRNIKHTARLLEKNNFTKVILFDSGDPWYKIAFNSLLIYEFRIMPHLEEVKYRIRPDTDGYMKSADGVVGVNNILNFAELMLKIGASIPESLQPYFYKNGRKKKDKLRTGERRQLYVFEIGGMTRARFEAFLKAKRRKVEDLNALVLPAYVPRELYPDAHALAEEVAKMITRFPKETREVYGVQVGGLSVALLRDINMACNGYYGGKDGFKKVLSRTLERCAEIQEILRILMDSRIITYGFCQNLTLISLKVQKDALIEQRLLEEKDSKYIQAIKDAKNFPKVLDTDLLASLPEKSGERAGYIEQTEDEE